MDETYIKMCDCPEIQGQWESKEGDKYSSRVIGHEGIYILRRDYAPDMRTKALNGIIVWLPRQEDIQAMFPDGTCWYEKHFRFYEWAGRTTETTLSAWNRFDSVEQTWLMFYMEAAHNKTWTEKGWVC